MTNCSIEPGTGSDARRNIQIEPTSVFAPQFSPICKSNQKRLILCSIRKFNTPETLEQSVLKTYSGAQIYICYIFCSISSAMVSFPMIFKFFFKYSFDNTYHLVFPLLIGLGILTSVIFSLQRNKGMLSFVLSDFFVILWFVYEICILLFSHQKVTESSLISTFALTAFYFISSKFLLPILIYNRSGHTRLIILLLILPSLFCLLVFLAQFFYLLPSNNVFFKATGPFDNPAKSGFYLGFLLIGLVVNLLSNVKKIGWSTKANILLVILITLIGLVVVFIFNRSVILAIIATVLFLVMLNWQVSRSVKCGALIFFTALLFGLGLTKSASSYGRLLIWRISCQVAKNRPLFGVGTGNFQAVYGKSQADYFSNHKLIPEILLADNVRYAYNDILQIYCEKGAIGILIFSGIIYFAFRRRGDRSSLGDAPLRQAGLGLLLFLLVTGLFSYPLHTYSGAITFYLALSLLAYDQWPKYTLMVKNIPVMMCVLLLSLALAAGWVTFRTAQKMVVYYRWQHPEFYTIDSNELQELYGELKDDDQFIADYIQTLMNESKYRDVILLFRVHHETLQSPLSFINIGIAFAAEHNEKQAERNLKLGVNMVPNKLSYRLCLAHFYLKFHHEAACREACTMILSLPQKVKSSRADAIQISALRILKQLSPSE